MTRDDEVVPKPGRIRDQAVAHVPTALSQIKAATLRAGGKPGGSRGSSGSRLSTFGRGRLAAVQAGRQAARRTVLVKARVVRMVSGRASLADHLKYLARDGTDRDGSPGQLFDADDEAVNRKAFADRAADDRHHFRFIVSPEDADQMQDLRGFTRTLAETMEEDLGTRLDWVAVGHWNTAHPHVHLIVRGVDETGADLVIAKDYIAQGLRSRAEGLVARELGPRTEREIAQGLIRDAGADRWTRLDRLLGAEARRNDGLIDLRPSARARAPSPVRLARLRKLEAMGLAEPEGVGRWRLSPQAEPTLKALARQGDIIARMHDAMRASGKPFAPDGWADDDTAGPVIGRVAARGLDDELTGTGYVLIEGTDGRLHHRTLAEVAQADPRIGAIVEAAPSDNPRLRHPHLRIRSDLTLVDQITAEGATWLDRLRVDPNRPALSPGFGAEVAAAFAERGDQLVAQGLAERTPEGIKPKPRLLATLTARELDAAAARVASETGLVRRPDAGLNAGDVYRRRLNLASGRFALIDDGRGFSLVPWRPAMERYLGQVLPSGLGQSGPGGPPAPGRRRGPSL
ncbi:type IV secretory pathway VirD2 relaxase [Brevundimonas sp. 1080]|uniref:relaxase/mobilization nuclease domain-containing protein n=1 Tax=Brevundimonas sp. 1080 TaxID=3156405 RepID=UPI00339A4CDA